VSYREPFEGDWEEWFHRFQDYIIPVRYYESTREVTVEELYQAFKARLAAEQEQAHE
jgi:hypothetical protein